VIPLLSFGKEGLAYRHSQDMQVYFCSFLFIFTAENTV